MAIDNRSFFIAFCIEQYKTAKGLDGAEVAKLFFDNGVDSYLSDNYEVLHTQSHRLCGFKNDCIMTDINQDNLYLLLPGIVSGVARIYAEENGCSTTEAIRQIYYSDLYPRLADESTKLWHLGPVALYKEMMLSMKNTTFVH